MSTATAGYRELIATQIARHPEQDAQALASRIAGMIPGDDLRDCARAYVRYEIDGYRRARAREAETRAAEAAHRSGGSPGSASGRSGKSGRSWRPSGVMPLTASVRRSARPRRGPGWMRPSAT